jgi:hypothetical protein
MADSKNLVSLLPKPGIQRDGTVLDSDQYTDGQWVRFQRGRPRKMGGFFRLSDKLKGPINNTTVFSEDGIHYITTFSPSGIEGVGVDDNGLGGAISNRTPSGYSEISGARWSVDSMYDAAAGSEKSILLATPTIPNSSVEQSIYWADASDLSQFQLITDVNASAAGGLFCAPPYAIYYGKDGRVTWSNQNEPKNCTTGDAGTNRVTGSKIVQGFSMRTGGGLGGILWSLDSVIRMDYIGGQAIFRFQKISQSASILTQNTVVEYDGTYYWVGNDRFLVTDGSRVEELPNVNNLNWFFDNLNVANKHKVWGMKIPRFGEIWWFFPFGDHTECSHAVIYNVREKTWYDVELPRSSGFHAQTLPFPLMCGSVQDNQYLVILSGITGSFEIQDLMLGGTSNGLGEILSKVGSNYYVRMTTGTLISGETVSNLSASGSAVTSSVTPTFSLYGHERGRDKIVGEEVLAIDSFYTTMDFGMPTGGLNPQALDGTNRWTRITRIEPDLVQSGGMSVEVLSREYATSTEEIVESAIFQPDTQRIDMRNQSRHVKLRFRSNTLGGHYEAGRTLLHLEPGDNRT